MIGLLNNVGSRFYRWWMMFAHALGYVNTKILLTIFYVLVIGPVWLIATVMRSDFLGLRTKGKTTFWKPRSSEQGTRESSLHQF